MTISRRVREILWVVGLLAIPLFVLRANTRAPHDLTFVDRAVLRLSSPLQAAATSTARAVGHGWSHYIYLMKVEHENDALRRETVRLRLELDRTRREAARAAQLERLLGLRAEVPAETATARVIGIDGSGFFRVARIRLDRGETEVRPSMPVLVPEGVVGRVGRVFGRYCDVLLSVDPKSSIDVVVPRTGGRGVLKGVSGENGYRARIEYLARTEDVGEGDRVVTSGIGGVFPRGLPVGTVSKVIKRDYGLYQEVEVIPEVDFSRLEEVLVVLSAPPPPDPDAERPGARHTADPHRGLGVPR